MVRIEDENREIIQKMLIRFNIENFLFNKHVSIERRRKNTTNHANFMLIFTEKLIEEFMNVFFFSSFIVYKNSTRNHQKWPKQYHQLSHKSAKNNNNNWILTNQNITLLD